MRTTVQSYPSLRPGAPPIGTATSAATAIYSPPRDGLPYIAIVFSPSVTIEAVRPFPSHQEANAFLQAFMQENAGEYGLKEHGTNAPTRMGSGS